MAVSSSPPNRMTPTSIRPAPCMAAWRRHCSIAAWDWPFCRTLEKGVGQTTLEFKISLVRPITPQTGLITAEGVVLSRGRRVGTAQGRITDGNGRLLAHGTTTCLIFQA